PVFNFADMAISTGVIALFVFQNKFFNDSNEKEGQKVENTNM
ncbi:MAG: hypothetical protein RLZ16_1101, partial [Bacteroidota bacterium]